MSDESGPYAALVEAFEAALPQHVAGLYLERNAHRGCYASVEDYYDGGHWVSEEERQRAIDADEVWSLQWYPSSPVGFYRVVASSLAAVLEAVTQADRESESGF